MNDNKIKQIKKIKSRIISKNTQNIMDPMDEPLSPGWFELQNAESSLVGFMPEK